MNLLRTSTMAAALLVGLMGIASAADKAPKAVSQHAAQPKAMMAMSTHGVMGKKHNFLATNKTGGMKDKAHGWMAPAKTSKDANKKG